MHIAKLHQTCTRSNHLPSSSSHTRQIQSTNVFVSLLMAIRDTRSRQWPSEAVSGHEGVAPWPTTGRPSCCPPRPHSTHPRGQQRRVDGSVRTDEGRREACVQRWQSVVPSSYVPSRAPVVSNASNVYGTPLAPQTVRDDTLSNCLSIRSPGSPASFHSISAFFSFLPSRIF